MIKKIILYALGIIVLALGQNISARKAYAGSDIITHAKFLPCSDLYGSWRNFDLS